MKRNAYLLTRLAGEYVAGRKVKQGEDVLIGTRANPLMLTPAEADHELICGTIVESQPETQSSAASPSATLPRERGREPRRGTRNKG